MSIFFEGLSCLWIPAVFTRVDGGTCLVIQGQLTEGGDVLGPLHQHQQLLLHGLTHIRNIGNLLPSDVSVEHRNRG